MFRAFSPTIQIAHSEKLNPPITDMNRFRIFLSLFVAIGALVFALRHHSLKQAQAEQAQLREQADERSTRALLATPAAETPVNATNSGLTEVERLELLRLRGQVGQLRRDLMHATNRPVSAPPRATTPAEDNAPIVSQAEARKRVAVGLQWATALIEHAMDNNQWPRTLADVTNHAPTGPADDFELVQSGKFVIRGSGARTIMLREKQPWKGTNGRWQRIYVFVDGHAEVAQSDTPDFTQWEEELKMRSN